jgi:hypothetical protein
VNLHIPRYDAVRLRRLKSFRGSASGNGPLPNRPRFGVKLPEGRVHLAASQLVWADACHGRIDSPCPAPCGGRPLEDRGREMESDVEH